MKQKMFKTYIFEWNLIKGIIIKTLYIKYIHFNIKLP